MLAGRVREKLETLPAAPGVYVFHGSEARVLYVGKAANHSDFIGQRLREVLKFHSRNFNK